MWVPGPVQQYHPYVLASVTDFVKYSFVPGSITFLLAAFLGGVPLLYLPRLRGIARAWLTLVAAAYVALATPAAAVLLERGLGPAPRTLDRVADAQGATAIVVLGAGAVTWGEGDLVVHQLSRRSVVNVLAAARIYRLLGGPPIIASGGIVSGESLQRSEADVMADTLVGLGIPRARITIDRASTSTYEQAANVAPLVKGHERFVLVTTPVHLRRAMALFEARGLHPVAGPSDLGALHEDPWASGALVPSTTALRASEMAIYEHLALGNARARGWLAAHDGIR